MLDGRDIGTVICPDAQIKLFITADVEERAKRRHKDMVDAGRDVTFEDVLQDLKDRDARDANRALCPLKPADDAIVIDTSSTGIDETFELVVNRCK